VRWPCPARGRAGKDPSVSNIHRGEAARPRLACAAQPQPSQQVPSEGRLCGAAQPRHVALRGRELNAMDIALHAAGAAMLEARLAGQHGRLEAIPGLPQADLDALAKEPVRPGAQRSAPDGRGPPAPERCLPMLAAASGCADAPARCDLARPVRRAPADGEHSAPVHRDSRLPCARPAWAASVKRMTLRLPVS